MKEIGQKLREAREKKGMSLMEIQESTKIRLRYLEAIESGDLDVIPGEVYRKGFISNYANAVGLDSEAILKEYHRLKTTGENTGEIKPNGNPAGVAEHKIEKSQTTPITKNNQPAPKASVLPGLRSTSKTVVRLTFKPGPPLFLTCAVLLLVLLVLLFSHSRVKTNVATAPDSPKKPVAAATAKKRTSITLGKATEQDNQSAKNSDASTTTQQIFPAPITVYAEFSSAVWIQLKSDGQAVYPDNGVTFNSKSPRQIWTARTEMVIRMGNPAGVKLLLNGKDLGPLGEEGMPKTITLTVNGITAP